MNWCRKFEWSFGNYAHLTGCNIDKKCSDSKELILYFKGLLFIQNPLRILMTKDDGTLNERNTIDDELLLKILIYFWGSTKWNPLFWSKHFQKTLNCVGGCLKQNIYKWISVLILSFSRCFLSPLAIGNINWIVFCKLPFKVIQVKLKQRSLEATTHAMKRNGTPYVKRR